MSIKDVEFVKTNGSVDAEEFKKMLEAHGAWLNNAGGKRLDLSNKKIRVLDMRGINLTCAVLRGANLRGVNLVGAVLDKADLDKADLTGANLCGTLLVDAVLAKARLNGACCIGASLDKANLTGADLRGANLREADLTGAELRGADLTVAELRGANLVGAVLDKADLTGANLRRANLRKADLTGANLVGAVLDKANLREADLTGADLTRAALYGARFIEANLTGADLTEADVRMAEIRTAVLENAMGLPALACPEKGSFTGWKYAFAFDVKDTERYPVLIELSIPASAKRSSGTGRKCRCSKAKVKRIVSMYTGEKVREAVSKWDEKFKYVVGETVEVKNFDENRWKECAPGIHFFMTQLEVFRFLFDPRPGEKAYNSFKRNGKIDKTIDDVKF